MKMATLITSCLTTIVLAGGVGSSYAQTSSEPAADRPLIIVDPARRGPTFGSADSDRRDREDRERAERDRDSRVRADQDRDRADRQRAEREQTDRNARDQALRGSRLGIPN